MVLRNERRPNTQGALHFPSSPAGEAREAEREEPDSFPAAHGPERPASTNRLMEEVCERANLKEAVRRVQANKGSPGVDGMTVDDLTGYLTQHWPTIRDHLLKGTYEPQPVRRVCSTNSTGSWSAEDTALFDMRTTATSTFAVSGRVSE